MTMSILLVGSDKSSSRNCKNVSYAQTGMNSKIKKNLCSYSGCTVGHLRPRLRGCATRHFRFDEREAEVNPAQVSSHHCCLHSPGFTRKQRESEHFRHLCCSPTCSCVPVLIQAPDVCSVYMTYLKTKHSRCCVRRKQIDSRLGCVIEEPGFIYFASIKSAWWQLWLKAIW